MSRFFQGQALNFDNNYFYQPPWELAAQAMAYNDQGINAAIEQARIIGDMMIEHIPDPREKEILQEELGKYQSQADNFSNNIQMQIQNNPQSWKKFMPGLKSLGADLNKNLTEGKLSKIRKSALNYAQWQKENEDIAKTNPALYNIALNHYMSNWANDETNPDRSQNRIWGGDKVIDYDMNSEEFMKDLKNLKADYWDESVGAYMVGTKRLSEEDIERYLVGSLSSSPKAQAYLQQMVNFKVPGFYDSEKGEAIPLYTAVGADGKEIELSQLNSEREKYMKLPPNLKNIATVPQEVLNPRHAWTRNINGKKAGFGFTERHLEQDKVKESAMDRAFRASEAKKDREHALELEGVKHENNMALERLKYWLNPSNKNARLVAGANGHQLLSGFTQAQLNMIPVDYVPGKDNHSSNLGGTQKVNLTLADVQAHYREAFRNGDREKSTTYYGIMKEMVSDAVKEYGFNKIPSNAISQTAEKIILDKLVRGEKIGKTLDAEILVALEKEGFLERKKFTNPPVPTGVSAGHRTGEGLGYFATEKGIKNGLTKHRNYLSGGLGLSKGNSDFGKKLTNYVSKSNKYVVSSDYQEVALTPEEMLKQTQYVQENFDLDNSNIRIFDLKGNDITNEIDKSTLGVLAATKSAPVDSRDFYAEGLIGSVKRKSSKKKKDGDGPAEERVIITSARGFAEGGRDSYFNPENPSAVFQSPSEAKRVYYDGERSNFHTTLKLSVLDDGEVVSKNHFYKGEDGVEHVAPFLLKKEGDTIFVALPSENPTWYTDTNTFYDFITHKNK